MTLLPNESLKQFTNVIYNMMYCLRYYRAYYDWI